MADPRLPADVRGPGMHILKTEESAWDAVAAETKTAEFRINDCDFRVDDVIRLHRGTGDGFETGEKFYANSRYIVKRITHVVHGPAFGIPEGFALLSLAPGIVSSDEVTG